MKNEFIRTLERVHNEINLASDEKVFQFLGPQVLGCKVTKRDGRVLVACGLSGVNLEFIVWPCLLQRRLNQVRLKQSKLGLARANGEGLAR